MKGIILLFFLFFTSQLSAQYFDRGVLSVIGKAGDILSPKNYCFEATSIQLPYGKGSGDKDLQNCALALCGPSHENQTGLITDVNFSKYATPKALAQAQKLEPVIKKVIEKSRTDKLRHLTVLRDALESNKLDGIDFSKIERYTRRDLFSKIFDQVVRLNVHPENDVKNRLQLTYNFPDWATEDFKEAARKYGKSFQHNYETRFDLFKSKSIYSNDEIKDLLKSRLAAAEILVSENPGAQYIDLYKTSLGQIQLILEKNEPVTYKEFDKVSMIENAFIKINPGISAQIECSTSECARALKDYFKNEITAQKLNTLIEESSDLEQNSRELNKCKASLVSQSIRAGNLKTANTQFKEAMASIEKNVLPTFSAHSRSLILKSLNQIKISVNKTPGDPSGVSESQFIKESTAFLNTAKVKDVTSTNEKLLSNLFSANQNEFESEINPCQKMNSSNLWDATEPDKKVIYISDYSCSHDMRGKQIVAHEIGHNINFLFSKLTSMSKESLKTYMDLRKCVSDNYLKSRKGNSYFELFTKIDNAYTEEDMADTISNMAFPDNKDLFSCALLYPDISNKGYVDPRLVPHRFGDPHSEGLFRVLMEMIQKGGQLPLSCQKAMENSSDVLGFNRCRN